MSKQQPNGTTPATQEENQITALAVFQSWSNLSVERIEKALPKSCGLTAERFWMIAFKLYHQLPKLKSCTQTSVGMAILTAAELGLELGSGLGQGWLLPFKIKGKLTAVLIIGYQGFIELFYRSGFIKNIYSVVVFKDDHFEYEMGLNPRLIHHPKAEAKNKTWEKFTHGYIVFEFTNGGKHFGVMTHAEIQAIKDASPGAKFSDSPWNHPDWWPEMVKKTLVKREGKYVPKSAEVARAIATDNEQYEYESEGEVITPAPANGSGVQSLKEQHTKKDKKPETVEADSETVAKKFACTAHVFQSKDFDFEKTEEDPMPAGPACAGPCGKPDVWDEDGKTYTCSSGPEDCERAAAYDRMLAEGPAEPAQASLPTEEEPEEPKDVCPHGKRKLIEGTQKKGKNKGKPYAMYVCTLSKDDPKQCEPNFVDPGSVNQEEPEDMNEPSETDIPF